MRIRIVCEGMEVTAQLDDTPTARRLYAALPVESKVHSWGEEIYFGIPLSTQLEPDARQVVDPGTVCFWVEGSSLAIPYGPTPVSEGEECRLVTDVNILGRIECDPRCLSLVGDGQAIRVERDVEG